MLATFLCYQHVTSCQSLRYPTESNAVFLLSSWLRASYFTLNKSPTRCNSMQSDLCHCKVTLHVSGVTAPIIRSAKNCNRYRSYRYSYFLPVQVIISVQLLPSGTGHIGTATSVRYRSQYRYSYFRPVRVIISVQLLPSSTGHNIGTATSVQYRS